MKKIKIGKREFTMILPKNFNNHVVIMNIKSTNVEIDNFIRQLEQQGYCVIIPDSSNDNVDDVNFIGRIIRDNSKFTYQNIFKRLWYKFFKRKNKVFLVGSSLNGLCSSRLANTRNDLSGVILINSINCDSVKLNGNDFTLTNEVLVNDNHCELMMISSKEDSVFNITDKIAYCKYLKEKANHLYYEEGGTHNWASWVSVYYPMMFKFLSK
jgi:dienelactone hydrolase